MRDVIRGAGYPLAFVAVVLVGGCAFGTRHSTLVYPPDEYPLGSPGYLPSAHAEPNRQPVPGDLKIALNAFTDERTNKEVVGTVRNAYSIRTADVVPTNSVTDWVTKAVRSELQSSGYLVTGAATGSDRASYVLSGAILNVFCDMYLDFSGRVALVATVSKDGKDVLNKRYEGKGNSGIVIAATSESFAQSLALALASAVRQFVADLNRTATAP